MWALTATLLYNINNQYNMPSLDKCNVAQTWLERPEQVKQAASVWEEEVLVSHVKRRLLSTSIEYHCPTIEKIFILSKDAIPTWRHSVKGLPYLLAMDMAAMIMFLASKLHGNSKTNTCDHQTASHATNMPAHNAAPVW